METDIFDPFDYTEFTDRQEELAAHTLTPLNRIFIKNYMIDNMRLLLSIDVANGSQKSVEYQTGFYKGATEALTYLLACHDAANSPNEETNDA